MRRVTEIVPAAIGKAAWIGHLIGCFLLLLMVLIQAAAVILRYGFAATAPWMQDLVEWSYGAIFMSGAAYCLFAGRHIRLDTATSKFNAAQERRRDKLGALALALPFVVMIGWMSWPFVVSSWQHLEASSRFGGLPFLFVFKSLLIVFPVLLGLAAICHAWRRDA